MVYFGVVGFKLFFFYRFDKNRKFIMFIVAFFIWIFFGRGVRRRERGVS